MTAKSFQSTPNGVAKMPGWYSWRHQTSEARLAARERYKFNRGKEARQRRAAERLTAKAKP